jgi:hypothetical protein
MHETKQFRENAERCEQLAGESTNEDTRNVFLDLATRWRRLADAIEADATRPEPEERA